MRAASVRRCHVAALTIACTLAACGGPRPRTKAPPPADAQMFMVEVGDAAIADAEPDSPRRPGWCFHYFDEHAGGKLVEDCSPTAELCAQRRASIENSIDADKTLEVHSEVGACQAP